MVLTVPVEFILLALTLAAVAVFHAQALRCALVGLAAIVFWKLAVAGFKDGPGLAGLAAHARHEWVILANLLLLLVSFALLARHVEASGLPQVMPAILPGDWKGGFALLCIIFVLSAVLDNIAAALIGGTVAQRVFNGRVHLGYVAAIVAASNAGGSGSVLGDTTTTMMWIAGISPWNVLDAYVAAVTALVVFGIPAALQQDKLQPITKHAEKPMHVDRVRLGVVAIILSTIVIANVVTNLYAPALLDRLPVLGLAVAAATLATASLRRPDWHIVPEAAKGALFLLALVAAASLMPVDKLPAPSWQTTLGLGFLSAVFDNIPLTALALKQGGYDWGMLAYAVGFGGSMLWFGSSAGIAISGLFPDARSAAAWVKASWYVPIAYVAGFAMLLATLGWHP